MKRQREGPTVHDGRFTTPVGCPRHRSDCVPLARVASPGYESFMCCGETGAAPVPTDRLRFCMLAIHAHGVDIMVNLDERDATDTASVLLGGMSALAAAKAVLAEARKE